MAEVRPLPGIRYATGNLAALVTPPYDVISPAAQDHYYARDPHNIIRLELGRDEPGDNELNNRYTRAAKTFADWRLAGVFTQDTPALYLYEQRFAAHGRSYIRRGLMARVGLEPWDAGVVLPHERTLSKPKDDRLKLLRACAANLSPIMALYDDPGGDLASLLEQVAAGTPAADFEDEAGERHRLWVIANEAIAARVAGFFRDRQLYIADGHHRYETALAYRDEVAALRKEPLPPDDPANFTLMSLTAVDDPGLVVLPTHRIIRGVESKRIAYLHDALTSNFDVSELPGYQLQGPTSTFSDADWSTGLLTITDSDRGSDEQPAVFVLAIRHRENPQVTYRVRLRPEGRAAMEAAYPEASAAWRQLDVAVLHELILNQALGISDAQVQAGEHVTYTRDAPAALEAVREGRDGAQVAVLLNPTPPAAIRDVARAGDRMPQKSTYFYPKLITGLVINPIW